jgi:hypothetical protein
MHTTAHIDFLRASGHEHHFAGGGKGTLTQDMTAEELRDSETSCATPSDTALAWFPVIVDPGDSVGGYEEVDRVNFYYQLESLHLMPAFGQIDLATHEGGDLSYGCGRNPTKLDAPPVGCTEGDWRVDADLPGTNVSVVIHYKNSDGVLGANPRVSTDAGFTDYRSMHVDYFATYTPEFVELVEACAQQMPNLADECRTTQQQLPNDQQADGLAFVEGRQTDRAQIPAAENSGALRGTEVETRSTDDDQLVDLIRIPLPDDCRLTEDTFSFVLQDDDGTQADFIEGSDPADSNIRVSRDGDILRVTSNAPDDDGNGPDEPDITPFNPRGGNEDLDTRNLEIVTSTGVRCQDDDNDGNNNNNNDGNDNNNDGNNNNNNDGNDNNNGVNNDINDTIGITPDTTTPTDAALETTTPNNADSVREADAFRCEFFLRTVRDDRGALRAQYQGDELIVQRFEQCLSEDVLADTIPNRNLPFTGGMSLLFLGAIGLAAIVAGVSVLRAVMRRTG